MRKRVLLGLLLSNVLRHRAYIGIVLFAVVLTLFVIGLVWPGDYKGNLAILDGNFLTKVDLFIDLFFHADSWTAEPEKFSMPLQVAKTLAPLLSLLAIFIAVFDLVTGRISLFLNSRGNHVVVFGLGGRGFPYAASCRKNNQSVVVVERDRNNPYVDAAKRQGIAVFFGDVERGLSDILKRVNLKKASKLVLFLGDNGLNTSVAMTASKEVRENAELEIISHVDSPNVSREIAEYAKFSFGSYASKIRFINAYELSTKEMFDDFPPDVYADLFKQETISIAVYGFGSFGFQVVLEGCRRLHQFNKRRPKFYVFDKQASIKKVAFLQQNTEVENIADVEFIDLDVINFVFTDDNICQISKVMKAKDITQHIICFRSYPNADNNLIAGLSLRKELLKISGANAPILIRLDDDPGGSAILESNCGSEEIADPVFPVGEFSKVLDYDSIHNEYEVSRAIAAHDGVYSEKEMEHKEDKGRFRKPSGRPWPFLAWHYKQSNIHQIQHYPQKLRAIRLEVLHGQRSSKQNSKPFNTFLDVFVGKQGDVKNRLAEVEHIRWNASLWVKGWSAPLLESVSNDENKKKEELLKGKRSDVARQHNCLVGWDDLTKNTQGYDLAFVDEMINTIQKPKATDAMVVRTYRVAILALPCWDTPKEPGDSIDKAVTAIVEATKVPTRAVKVVSTLAEGASLLVCKEAVKPASCQGVDFDLNIFLPAPMEVYKDTFGGGTKKELNANADKSIRNVTELLGRKNTRYYEMPLLSSMYELSIAGNKLFVDGCPPVDKTEWFKEENGFCKQYEMTLARMVERCD